MLPTLLAAAAVLAVLNPGRAAAEVVLWDTGAPLAMESSLYRQGNWTAVPSVLFALETDPAKAASDPGYYGREYAFQGDPLVENDTLAALFCSARGRVAVYAKADASARVGPSLPGTPLGARLLEFAPFAQDGLPTKISACEITRNAGDEVALKVTFTDPGAAEAKVLFVFDQTEIIEIRPGDGVNRIHLGGPIEYGIVPSFIGDDLIYAPADYPSTSTLHVPPEQVFLGLMPGRQSEFLLTWHRGNQRLHLELGMASDGDRLIESLDFDSAGESFYLAALRRPGLWHKETLAPSYLEREVKLDWQPPFPAKWQTQLLEANVKTTFAFRESKAKIWRGVPGHYAYPVWFDGGDAFLHLSKKVPPKGESLVYCLEGRDTPRTVRTPADLIKATLGRQASESILDIEGRKLRTHHRRGGEGVHRACTCGYTEFIQAFFETNQEVARRKEIEAALEDMMFFVQRHVERIHEYRRFADGTITFLESRESSEPDLKPFLEGLKQVAGQIHREYEVQKENMKSLGYAEELVEKTLALTEKQRPGNLENYMELLKAWRAMGGAQDYVVAQYHMIARKLFQDAGYGCVEQPEAVPIATAVRERCRQILRNPDGYEIWANY